MKINKIRSSEVAFGHQIESKVFYQNKIGSRVVDKITLDNGKRVYIDVTTLHGKVLCKIISLYDRAGKFVRTLAKSYNDGKLTNIRHIDYE